MGKSKHPNITYQLATRLFERSETRGTDASGFWGCQPGEDGAVVYHKEPRKASQFIHGDPWKRLKGMSLNVLIMHARASSQGVGDAIHNKNNHPFTNSDRSVGLVHNGRIFEYSTLKKRYEVKSDCDSEILLRIFERSRTDSSEDGSVLTEGFQAPEDILHSMQGIREIFSYVNDSHMAVAIGERRDKGRRDLWLFHNEKRPLWVIDAREAIGQVFFCSTPDIWSSALRDCPQAMGVLGGRRHTIVPMPTEEIWYFSVDDDHPVVEGQDKGYYCFRLNGENEYTPWDDDGPNFPILPASRQIPVLCDLGENDEFDSSIVLPSRNRHKRHKNKCHWETTEETSKRSVVFTKHGAHYSDEEEDDEDDDIEITDLNDDLPPEEHLETQIERYHGMTPMEFDESHQLVPMDRHVEKIGKVVNRNLKDRHDVGYDEIDAEETIYNRFDVTGLSSVVKDIRQVAGDIETTALNLAQEGSLTVQRFEDNLESLRSILIDLQGSQHMLEGY